MTASIETNYMNFAESFPEAHERLMTIIALIKLRDRLTDPRYGWLQDKLWTDQDAEYPGHGPTCLTGGVAVVAGRGDLTDDDIEELDDHAVIVALDATLATYPNHGRQEGITFGANVDPDHYWTKILNPVSRLAVWNDLTGRTKREVITLIDKTIERLENA